jgi:hypothetical protein
MTTIYRVTRIAPLQAGKIAAVLYGILGVATVPFVLLAGAGGGSHPLPLSAPLLFIPLYAVAGFVMTVSMAWLYNVVAERIGGVEITLRSGSGT